MTASTIRSTELLPSSDPRHAEVAPREPRKTFGYKLAFGMWLIYMFDPQMYIANATGFQLIQKLPLTLTGVMLVTLMLVPPKRMFLLPYALIAVFLLARYRFAPNPAYAEVLMTQSILFFVVGLGMATFIKTPKQAIPFLLMFMLLQFVWWGLWGVKSGGVPWHYVWFNYDGYGPLTAVGVAGAFHYGVATRNPRLRLLSFATALLCVMALVSTFARGSFLSLIAVMVWIWVRAPRKGVATGFVAAAAISLFVATTIFSGAQREAKANFFDEMGTIFDEYHNSSGTTGDREVLWRAAVEVWKSNPLMGVGGGNFGVYASEHLRPSQVGGEYKDSPARLYGRDLHNIFYQILAEYGIIGCLLYLWLLADFFKRNRRLLSPAANAVWIERGGRAVNLNWIAAGLTAMMIAYLANGMFYNLLEVDILPAIVILNALLYQIVKPLPVGRGGQLPKYRGFVPPVPA